MNTETESQNDRKTSLVRLGLFAAAILSNLDYLVFIVNPAHADNLPFFLATALADVIAIVIFTSTWVTAFYFEVFRGRYYSEVDKLRRHGKQLLDKPVAVLVPVVNEDLSILRNTLRSVLAMRGKKQVYVLDDGRRQATLELAQELGVEYVTRRGNKFFKAGNLNNGLHRIWEEFVLVVDADFAVRPNFIERTLPLFSDPTIAAVQTPQVYSNEDTLFARGSKYLQVVFYRYLQPGRNLIDSSFCVGTNVIYRRSALEEVGGIAQVDHSEDVFTTLKFLEVGKRVFYLNEQLAVGLAPATLIGYYNQQFRWARGGFEMMFKHGTLFNRRLRVDQRVQFFFSNFFYLSGITVAIYLLSPLVAVVFNVKPISDPYFWQWLPKYALFFVCNLGFFISFAPRNRIATMVLGTFSYLPYTAAMVVVLTGFPLVAWKPTNARATGLITILLAPYIVFVVVAGAVAGMLVTRTMRFNATLGEYYFWLAADLVVAVFFIIHAYIARSRVILPSFDDPQPRIDPRPVMTAAEAA